MGSNKLEMVKCEKLRNKYVPNKNTEKSVNSLVIVLRQISISTASALLQIVSSNSKFERSNY